MTNKAKWILKKLRDPNHRTQLLEGMNQIGRDNGVAPPTDHEMTVLKDMNKMEDAFLDQFENMGPRLI